MPAQSANPTSPARLTFPVRVSLAAMANAHKALQALGYNAGNKSALLGSAVELFAIWAQEQGLVSEPFEPAEAEGALAYLQEQGLGLMEGGRRSLQALSAAMAGAATQTRPAAPLASPAAAEPLRIAAMPGTEGATASEARLLTRLHALGFKPGFAYRAWLNALTLGSPVAEQTPQAWLEALISLAEGDRELLPLLTEALEALEAGTLPGAGASPAAVADPPTSTNAV